MKEKQLGRYSGLVAVEAQNSKERQRDEQNHC